MVNIFLLIDLSHRCVELIFFLNHWYIRYKALYYLIHFLEYKRNKTYFYLNFYYRVIYLRLNFNLKMVIKNLIISLIENFDFPNRRSLKIIGTSLIFKFFFSQR